MNGRAWIWIAIAGGAGALLLLSRKAAASADPGADPAAPGSTLLQDVLTVVGPRGIRNNNPGNIRRSSERWQGLADVQTDPEFFQFIAPEYGIRAIAVILQTYRDAYGRNTIRKIITRWAPPMENDTEAYIQDVAAYVGVDPDQPLTGIEIPQLVAAIIKHENGVQPYDVALIDQGVSMA